MKDKLIQLFNTMKLIDVKGDSVLILADCLRFVDGLIQDQHAAEESTGE